MANFVINPRPPYRLDSTVWVLRRLPVNAMDRWDGECYRRVLAIDGIPIEIIATQTGPRDAPRINVQLNGETTKRTKQIVRETLVKMLGIDIDLAPFRRLAGSDPKLAEIAGRFAGFSPPLLPSVFEAMVNGIACQQISLINGLQLLNRLCARFGLKYGEHFAFPQPVDLADATTQDMRALGFSGRKGDAIINRAREIVEGSLDLDALHALSDADAVAWLRMLGGIGRWTAEYIALRGLGRLDVYPADDVGSQKRVQAWMRLENRPDYEDIYRIVDRCRPYRGLIYFYLLLNEQARRGWVREESPQ